MIIKTETAIVDTNTYDSFFIEYRESKYRLLAVSKYTTDTVPLYTANDKTFVENVLDDIYRRFNRGSNICIDLGV